MKNKRQCEKAVKTLKQVEEQQKRLDVIKEEQRRILAENITVGETLMIGDRLVEYKPATKTRRTKFETLQRSFPGVYKEVITETLGKPTIYVKNPENIKKGN